MYNTSEILVLNAQTGEKLGTLANGDIVNHGTLKLCDVKAIDGHIVACNIATKANGEKLRIYAWDSDNALPYILLETDDYQGATRLGDCLECTGTFATDAWYAFGATYDGHTSIVEYNRKDGNWTAKHTLVYTAAGKDLTTGATVRAYPKGSGWWVDGKNSQPSWTVWDDAKQGAVVQTTCPVPFDRGSSHHEFYWKGQKYATSMIFADNNGSSCKMRILQDKSGDFKTTSEIGQWPSDGLGGSNNTNGTGDIQINTDGDTYLECWILSTSQGLAYFTTGTVPAKNPDPITPPVEVKPSMSVDRTALSFDCKASESATAELNVTVANLRGNITCSFSGADAGLFMASPTTLSASGKLTIYYNPQTEGTHSATLTLRSTDVNDITVSLNGTATASTVNPVKPFSDEIIADEIEEVWKYDKDNNGDGIYEHSSSKDYTSSIALIGDKLYVLNCKSYGSPSIVELDAYTGKKIRNISLNGISGGTFVMGSIFAADGKLYATNIVDCSDATKTYTDAQKTFKLYRWDDIKGDPAVVYSYDASSYHLAMGRRASYAAGYLWVPKQGSNQAFRIGLSNGTVSKWPTTISFLNASGKQFGSTADARGAASIIDGEDGTIWVICKDYYPVNCKVDGTYVKELKAGTLTQKYGTDMTIMPFGQQTYVAATAYASDAKGQEVINAHLDLFKANNGLENAEAPLAKLPANGFGGTEKNSQFISTVLHSYRHDNQVLDMWVCVPFNGIAHYSYDGRTEQGIDGISTEDANAPVEYYNLQGVKMTGKKLIPGVYIRRQGNTAEKVLVK